MTDLRVLVDGRPITHPTAGGRGIGNYTIGLVEGLHAVGADVVVLVDSEPAAPTVSSLPAPTAVWQHRLPVGRATTWYIATGLFLHPIDFDPIPRAVTHAGLPVAGIIYDMIPYRDPARYQADDRARRIAQLRAPLARTVDLRLAISQHAGDAASAVLGPPNIPCEVIGAGVRSLFRPGDHATRRSMADAPDEVVTVVSLVGSDPRKTRTGCCGPGPGFARPTVRSVRSVGSCYSVMCRMSSLRAGTNSPGSWGSVTRSASCVARMTPRSSTCSAAPSSSCSHRSRRASVSPIIEAATCGAAVIGSNTGAGPEILDEIATFDPYDDADIAVAIERALWDHDHRAAVLAAGRVAAHRWTWPQVGRRVLDRVRSTGPRRPRPRHRRSR